MILLKVAICYRNSPASNKQNSFRMSWSFVFFLGWNSSVPRARNGVTHSYVGTKRRTFLLAGHLVKHILSGWISLQEWENMNDHILVVLLFPLPFWNGRIWMGEYNHSIPNSRIKSISGKPCGEHGISLVNRLLPLVSVPHKSYTTDNEVGIAE